MFRRIYTIFKEWEINMFKILVVEDDKNISQLIKDTLSLNSNFIIRCVMNGEQALNEIHQEIYNIIILDIMIPKINGFEIFEQIKDSEIPVIFLTAKTDIESKIKALRNGAQDYITKPFEPLELLARVELRLKKDVSYIINYKDITINTKERTVLKNDEKIELAPKEYDLLILLINNIGSALSREYILKSVWDIDTFIETRTIDYHIQQLRKKLNLKNEIVAVNKIGYRLEKINEI